MPRRALRRLVKSLHSQYLRYDAGHLGQLLGRFPIVTNTMTFASLLGISDLAMQSLSHYTSRPNRDKRLVIDWPRSRNMFTIGLCIGPGVHGWYKYLDYVLPTTQLKSVGCKVLMDQLIFGPVLYYGFFISGGMLEGCTYNESLQEFKNKFWTVYKADWAFWPAAQFINFSLVPSSMRVLYFSVATLFWNVFLSYVKYDMDADSDPARTVNTDVGDSETKNLHKGNHCEAQPTGCDCVRVEALLFSQTEGHTPHLITSFKCSCIG